MDLTAWIEAGRRTRLRRVRLAGLVLAAGLCGAAVWLGTREVRLQALPSATDQDILRQEKLTASLDLIALANTLYLAKLRSGKTLKDITGNAGTENACLQLDDLRRLPQDHPCRRDWREALEKVWRTAHPQGDAPLERRYEKDPWGSPYLLGETEYICGSIPGWCPQDSIRSAGPDGRPGTQDDLGYPVPQHLAGHKVP